MSDLQLAIPAEEMPTFNFDELSWGDSLDLIAAQTKILELAAPDVQMTNALMLEVMDAFQAITRHLSLVVTSVPDSWWANGAPEKPDMSDPATFRWVKQRCISKLMKAMRDAQEAEKNE